MSLFSDLISGTDGVYTLTNRPDLIAETALAVRAATLHAHHSDFFPRDIQEIDLPFATPAANWSLDIPTYFPSWRAFKYIRPYTVLTGARANFIIGRNEFLAPDAIFDEYLTERLNMAYVGGSNLNMKLEAPYDGLTVGYYKNPTLAPDANYDSWIARDFGHIIVIDATMRVFQSIGYNDEAARLKTLLFGPEGDYHNVRGGYYMLLKSSSLEGVGA